MFPLFLWFSCFSFFHNGKLIFFGESVIELRMRKNYAIVPMIVLVAVSFLLQETMTVYIESIEKR